MVNIAIVFAATKRQFPICRAVSYIRVIARPVRTLVVAIPDIFQKPQEIATSAYGLLAMTVEYRNCSINWNLKSKMICCLPHEILACIPGRQMV